jgi:hypothetical protein
VGGRFGRRSPSAEVLRQGPFGERQRRRSDLRQRAGARGLRNSVFRSDDAVRVKRDLKILQINCLNFRNACLV